jgi:acetyl-CoA carboxylase biotin carboxylase subunit
MAEFSRVLVANRGEIALRVLRALKALEIETIAVYSDADISALHVREADRAYRLEGVFATETYLNIEKIIEIARRSDADAVHPGYGFLSENPKFAKQCEESSIKFIGPSSKTLEISGDKFQCKKLAKKSGVPVIPASEEPVADSEDAAKIAQEIGFPVLLKSAFGGGGRGIKEARSKEEVKDAFESSQREAKSAFGRFEAFIEKKLFKPRHIEIQVVADDDSSEFVHLGERECSIQRRYQKLVELSPSPIMNEETRLKVANYAVKVARAVNYSNAGTIEFLRDSKTGKYYFLEVNSRLQVEHPVTEFVTGVDIVASQIRIASRGKFPIRQKRIRIRGCAIECRINAEDPLSNFAPSTGKITYLHVPGGPGIRVDTATFEEQEISPYYDSLIAKLISWGESFQESRQRMISALNEFKIVGVETTIPFHERVMRNDLFSSGRINTSFLEESDVMKMLSEEREQIYSEENYLIAALLLSRNQFPEEAPKIVADLSAQRRVSFSGSLKAGGRFIDPL